MLRRLSILGATGSVGESTCALIDTARDEFEIIALTGGQNLERLIVLARRYRPRFVVIADEAHYVALVDALMDLPIEVAAGADALVQAARIPTDISVAAIVGVAGLAPTLAALEHSRRVVLANKEVLVAAGDLFMRTAEKYDTQILPADSEHNAIAQILDGWTQDKGQLAEIILTASGGPFWNRSLAEMAHVTPSQACAHPNWQMGAKISVDSASMMNKGLELIEAQYLFSDFLLPQKLSIIVHPQSAIHGLVRFIDGGLVAALGVSDMRLPLAWCLGWPMRMASGAAELDLVAIGQLDFAAPDDMRFPCLALARDAMRHGGNMPNVLNAANEVAVAAFLEGTIGFTDIASFVAEGLEYAQGHMSQVAESLLDILAIDAEIRHHTYEQICRDAK